MAGIPATKTDIDLRAGEIAANFQRNFGNVVTMQQYLAATPDEELIALGYDAAEVATLKTAFTDLMQLANIWAGAAALPAAKDFRTFVSQLWGVGTY
jgi:hypothetical protein